MLSIQKIKSERFRRLFKESFWIVLGQAMAVLGSLVGVRLLTELLSPTAYGELALGMTVSTMANLIIFGPLGVGAARFYAPAAEVNDVGGYLKAVRHLMLAATGIIILALLLIGLGLLIIGRHEWIAITSIALVFAILSGYNSILGGVQNAARQRSIVALHQGMESWARFLIAGGMIWCLGATSTVVMIGYVIGTFFVLASQYVFYRKIVSSNRDVANHESWQRKIMVFSRPFGAWGIFVWAQSASDRWALGLFATTQEVGWYAVLFQLGYYPISMATGMAVQLLTPILYQHAGDGSDSRRNSKVNRLTWRLTGLALGMTGLVFMVTIIFHEQIFKFFVAAEYSSVSFLLPWMMLSGGVFAAGQTISLNLMSQMKTHMMIAAKIVTALCGIALNFYGAYMYGIKGLVIASLLFSTSYFLWMLTLTIRLDHHK